MNSLANNDTATAEAEAGSPSNAMDGAAETNYSGMTATYSPEDNKLRLYSVHRLDKELYERVKAHGFKYAPRQELFVAPMWTPQRADLLTELCGEIGDEDTSLVDRAEERAERFDDYSDSRRDDAHHARAAVARIADGIPFGQPILIGHHSEKHARRDAEKIENGMRKAVKMWETAEYWKYRAEGALAHAKYKERPDVRARRIKTLESDKRKQERTCKEATARLSIWTRIHEPDSIKRKDGAATTMTERALFVLNSGSHQEGGVRLEDGSTHWSGWSALSDGKITAEEIQRQRLASLPRVIAWTTRWIEHYDNRLTYERAMLGEAGGLESDRVKPQKGGGCKCWASHRNCWSYIVKVNKVSVTVLRNWGNGGRNFPENIAFDKLRELLPAADVEEARQEGRLHETEDKTGFVITMAPTDDKPSEETSAERHQREHREHLASLPAPSAEAESFKHMRDSLRQGVQIVTAPQLFPTPAALAARMVELADIEAGHRVLEPSGGTGRLLRAIKQRFDELGQTQPDVVAVEIKAHLADVIRTAYRVPTHCEDFLQCSAGRLGTFDRIILNPPFENAVDIRHILHARSLLNAGGVLVGLCAAGPRQIEQLEPLVEACGGLWEPLPDDTFAAEGTRVRTILLTLHG